MPADGPAAPTTPAPLDAAGTRDALATARVVRWWQVTRFVELVGPDAVSFLADLSTQAVERIEPGTHQLGLLLEPKAHIVAAIDVYRTTDAVSWTDPKRGDVHEGAPRLLLETLPDQVDPLVAQLGKYRLRARVTIEPVELASIALVGATALEPTTIGGDAGAWLRRVGRADDLPTSTWIGAAAAAADVVARLADSGEPLADPAALEAARIEAGTVSLHDLLAGRMPAEVGGVEAAVALDAGCYVGQEPVVRLHFRGRANRTLRRVTATGPVVPAAPEAPEGADDGVHPLDLFRTDGEGSSRAVGRLTTWSERADGTTIGFATLRRELEPGDELRLGTSSTRVTVSDAAPASRVDVRAT